MLDHSPVKTHGMGSFSGLSHALGLWLNWKQKKKRCFSFIAMSMPGTFGITAASFWKLQHCHESGLQIGTGESCLHLQHRNEGKTNSDMSYFGANPSNFKSVE